MQDERDCLLQTLLAAVVWCANGLLSATRSFLLSAEASISDPQCMLSRLAFKTTVADWWWCQHRFHVHVGDMLCVLLAASRCGDMLCVLLLTSRCGDMLCVLLLTSRCGCWLCVLLLTSRCGCWLCLLLLTCRCGYWFCVLLLASRCSD